MGCRMLIATGELPLSQLLDGFRLMALNRNEGHEYRGDPEHIHGDGWGTVTGRAGRFESYKSVIPCWQDSKFADLYETDPDFIMLHARRASPGVAVKSEFTHPFEEDGWYFCHNGMIHDFEVKRSSDSQQLFALVVENLRQCRNVTESISRTVKSLNDYSALNFMLCKDDQLYVLNMYGKRGAKTPNYFTIKYLQSDDYTIIASERLHGCGEPWQEMQNGTLLTVAMPDRRIQFCGV
ncbi:MAG: class II glutamine amidotransferase [Dehalococcoidia bacterium]|nr:class II glutamine amidotransferase [Dehalococcoidia bacterium]